MGISGLQSRFGREYLELQPRVQHLGRLSTFHCGCAGPSSGEHLEWT